MKILFKLALIREIDPLVLARQRESTKMAPSGWGVRWHPLRKKWCPPPAGFSKVE